MRLRDRWIITSTLLASFTVMGCQTPSALVSRDETKARDPQRLIEIARTFENQGYKRNAMAIYGQLANGSPFAAEARERFIALGGQWKNAPGQSNGVMIAKKTEKSSSAHETRIVAQAPPKLKAQTQSSTELQTVKEFSESTVVATEQTVVDSEMTVTVEEMASISEPEDTASLVANDEVVADAVPEPKTIEAEAFPSLVEDKVVSQTKTTETTEVTTVSEIIHSTETLVEETLVETTVADETETAESTAKVVTQNNSDQAEWNSTTVSSDSKVEELIVTASQVEPNLDEFIPPPLPEDQVAAAKSLVEVAEPAQKLDLTELSQGATEDVLAHVRQLSSETSSERTTACFELAKLGPKASAAGPAIEQSLSGEDSLFKAHAAFALYEIGGSPETAVQALIEVLKSGDSGAVQLAAYYLGKMSPEAIVAMDALKAHLSSEANLVTLHCAEAMLKLEPSNAVALEAMVACIHAEDNMVRWLAAQSVSNINSTEKIIVDALESLLYDSDPRIQTAAALSIGGFGDAANPALPRLHELSHSEEIELQEAAKTSIACLQKKESQQSEEQ